MRTLLDYEAGDLPASFTRPVEFTLLSIQARSTHALTTMIDRMPVGFPDSFTALDFRPPFIVGFWRGTTFVAQQHGARKMMEPVSPSCHATPGIGRRSPATRMTEARIPLDFRVARHPKVNSTAHPTAGSFSGQANGGSPKGYDV